MTPEEIAADEAQHREIMASVPSHHRPIAADALNPKPIPQNLNLVKKLNHFTAKEEACEEMTRTRKPRRFTGRRSEELYERQYRARWDI